jgi:hypothetical protein
VEHPNHTPVPNASHTGARCPGVGVGRPGGRNGTDGPHEPVVAVVVCHGMGQQVRFETIDTVARVLARTATARGDHVSCTTARLVRLSGEHVGRAELTIQLRDAPEMSVHVYEAYWAPFTEGAVRLADVVSFLARAAWQGGRHALVPGGFARFIFQRWIRYPVEPRACLPFALALLFVAALLLMNGAVAGGLLGRLLTNASASPWPPRTLVLDWTGDLAIFGIPATVLAALLGVLWFTRVSGAGAADAPRPPSRATTWAVWGAVWTTVAGTVAAALLMVAQAGCDGLLASPAANVACRSVSFARVLEPAAAAVVPIGLAFLALSWLVSRVLVRFVGDVAAYISSNRLDRFYALRERIQQVCARVVRAVYEDRRYDRCIVAGHSLGSVVAYDALNAVINEDLSSSEALDVVARTPLFITLGSPLDKTAFVFRTQRPEQAAVREALAAAMQPMIVNYRSRPARWVNIWSRRDWISGRLDYYDDPLEPDARRIRNVEEPAASIPLLAHLQYWTGTVFGETLYDTIREQVPADAPQEADAQEPPAAEGSA